jgi:hypothetical protein
LKQAAEKFGFSNDDAVIESAIDKQPKEIIKYFRTIRSNQNNKDRPQTSRC